jgi:light-regulated signal transduction histidine kinase (bacteriophytochrome)
LDDQYRHFDVRITEIANPAGDVIGRQIVLRDISERRRAEMALRQANRDLQRRNEELDVFAMTAAHDLKDPLSTMMGYASLLKSQDARLGQLDTGGLTAEIPDIIWQTGMEMTNVINALSLLATVSRETIKLEPLDMPSLVASAEQRLGHLIAEYDAEIHHPKSLPSSVGYGPWIGEVWVNYLRNAIRYSDPPVGIEIGATDEENGAVRYWIRQQSRAAETPGDLLQEFTWMGQVGPRSHGLGNTIVRRIMERLGGEAGIQRLEDGCMLYYFTLPKLEQ